MKPTHVIKAGNGVWDTTSYPLGGKFIRESQDLPVEAAFSEPVKTRYGYLCCFKTADGRTLWADERAFKPIEEANA